MEFHVHLAGARPDLRTIERIVLEADPAAVVDLDATGDTLRVAGSLTAVEVGMVLRQAGYSVAPEQVEQLPSVCCGGCSG